MFVSRLRSIFARREPESRPEEETPTPSPFVVGAGRSGTTLLRLMLDAHPELAIPPETDFIPQAAEACEGAPDPRQAFLDIVVSSNRRWGDYGLGRDLLEQRISAIEPFDLTEALRAFYELYAEKLGKPRWGDKTPRYVRQMDLIQGLLPEARFVHIIRDGRDVALSSMGLWFGPASIEQAARRWQATIKKARRRSRKLSHYLEIRYEDLITDTEPALKRICEYVGLSWNPSMLDYHKTAGERISEMDRDSVARNGRTVRRGEERVAMHSLTSRPPQSDRIGRWRQEMPPKDRARFEAIAGETLRELGYDVG